MSRRDRAVVWVMIVGLTTSGCGVTSQDRLPSDAALPLSSTTRDQETILERDIAIGLRHDYLLIASDGRYVYLADGRFLSSRDAALAVASEHAIYSVSGAWVAASREEQAYLKTLVPEVTVEPEHRSNGLFDDGRSPAVPLPTGLQFRTGQKFVIDQLKVEPAPSSGR